MYAEEWDSPKIASLLESMKALRIKPDATTFHMLLRTFQYSRANVMKIFAIAKEKGVQLSVDSYTIAIRTLAEENGKDALALLQELRSVHGPECLTNAFTSIVLGIGKRKGPRSTSLDEGLAMFRNASRLGIKADSALFSAAISLALFHQNLPLAEKLVAEAFRVVSQPEVTLFNQQMDLCYQLQKPTEALEVYSRLKCDPYLKPSVATNLILIRIYFSLPVSGEEAVNLVSPLSPSLSLFLQS